MDDKTLNSRSAALGLWTVLAMSTVVVASRRMSGSYTGPLPNGALVVAVFLGTATSAAALWLFRRKARADFRSWTAWLPELTAWGLPTLFSLVVAAEATPGQIGALLGMVALGAILLGIAALETTAWWTSLMSSKLPALNSLQSDNIPQATGRGESAPIVNEGTIRGSAGASPSLSVDESADLEEEVDDETTTQWMTRREEADGEAIEGTVRVHFAPGQRDVVLHVTFCPPLPSSPAVELESVDGDDWQMKTEAALPYGLRIQVRRSTAITLEQTGQLAYLATSQRPARAA